MHILLTDILTCPRCGPAHGLILLADRIEDRRVTDGVVGCANCRATYPIRHGIVDFAPAVDDATGTDAAADAAEPAMAVERLAALLGVARGPAFLLLAGPAAVHAGAIAGMLDDVEVIAIPDSAVPAGPGVNPIVLPGRLLPVTNARVAGVALTGAAADALLEEGARVLASGGRLVLDPVPADAAVRAAPFGVRIAAQQDAVAVAVRD